MEELVIQNGNGNNVTTSLIVAQVFGKEHNKVVRDIENLLCSTDFRVANFGVIDFSTENEKRKYLFESLVFIR